MLFLNIDKCFSKHLLPKNFWEISLTNSVLPKLLLPYNIITYGFSRLTVVVDDFISSVRFDINKILLAVERDELDKYQNILADRFDGLLDVYKSAPYFLEIMPFGVTKGSMLPLLLDKLKIKREELAAFGDNYNDMTMIGYAGFGVAMGNAETDVKKIADYICESNDNDGIANTLDKFVLKQ